MKLFIGRDIKNNESVYIDASKSRPILICGKRGSGKSYTLGVIAEEICSLDRENVVPLIVDPMGIYWCMCEPNSPQREALCLWSPMRGLLHGFQTRTRPPLCWSPGL